MRIFLPTSNDYIWACEATCMLLHKYWRQHPPVDVVHFEASPSLPRSDDFRSHDFGKQAACRKWIDQFVRYLRGSPEEHILVMLDDYAIFQAVNTAAVQASVELLRADPMTCGVALTWQPARKDLREDGRFVDFPPWPYSVNTQAGLWRRSDLLTIFTGCAARSGVWDFEQTASRWFHEQLYPQGHRIAGWNCPEPHNPSTFVDSVDKTGWAIAYNNLIRRRKFDERHREFITEEGIPPPCLPD